MPILMILANVIAAAAMVAVLTASGARVRRWLRLPSGPSDRWATDLVIGAGLCCLWILALGLVGLLRPAAVLGGIAAQASIGLWRRNRRPLGPVMFAVAAGLPNLIIAAGPPHFYDAMVYHLGLPWQALLEGGWTAHPENLFSAFPPLAQMVSVPPLAFDLLRVPGLLHWWAWIAAAVAAGGLARRLGASRPMGHLVTAAVMLLPITPLVPGFPAAEGWFLAALIPAVGTALTQARRQSSLPLMMLLLGLATATRVQGLTWLAILLALRMITTRSRAFLLRGLGLVVIGSAPWWLKNLFLLSDPLAPIFWSREGVETLWRDGGALIKTGVSSIGIVKRLPSLLGRLTPVFLPTFAAAGLAAISARRNRPLFAAAVLGLAAWTTTGALPRFFAPTMILLIVAASVLGQRPLTRMAAALVVAGTLTFGFAVQSRWLSLVQPLTLLMTDFVAAASEVSPNPSSAAFRTLDERLPPHATLLLVAEPRTFGAPRPVVAPSQHDPSPLRAFCEGAGSPAAIAKTLRRQGITHLMINEGELARLAEDYPVTPWKTVRGEGRWGIFIQSLGPPILEMGGITTYSLVD